MKTLLPLLILVSSQAFAAKTFVLPEASITLKKGNAIANLVGHKMALEFTCYKPGPLQVEAPWGFPTVVRYDEKCEISGNLPKIVDMGNGTYKITEAKLNLPNKAKLDVRLQLNNFNSISLVEGTSLILSSEDYVSNVINPLKKPFYVTSVPSIRTQNLTIFIQNGNKLENLVRSRNAALYKVSAYYLDLRSDQQILNATTFGDDGDLGVRRSVLETTSFSVAPAEVGDVFIMNGPKESYQIITKEIPSQITYDVFLSVKADQQISKKAKAVFTNLEDIDLSQAEQLTNFILN